MGGICYCDWNAYKRDIKFLRVHERWARFAITTKRNIKFWQVKAGGYYRE